MNNIWWKLYNPSSFITDIVSKIEKNQSSMYTIPCDLPWYDEFRNILESRLDQVNSSKVECFSAKNNDNIIELGKFLLKELSF